MKAGLKPIILLSYFFPPCTLTAAQRTGGWVKYLHIYGYYPIVITRNWDLPIEKPEDVLRSTGKEIQHKVYDTHEVYYLPHRPSLRERLFVRTGKFKLLRLMLKPWTVLDLFLENFTNLPISHASLYDQARKIIQERMDIELMLISGNPFNTFRFGYLLHEEFNIPWIADYRDDWNTTELTDRAHPLEKWLKKWSSRSERKWVGSSCGITSVSPVYTQKISRFTERPGEVILNGFDESETEHLPAPSPDPNTFTITYNGTLYATQQIEGFIDVIKHLEVDPELHLPIVLNFPGLAFDPVQEKRVRLLTHGMKSKVIITPRIPKKEVLLLQRHSDLLLMLSHQGIKGVPGSKLYEYLSLERPILLFPNDHDIVEQTLQESGCGISCENEVKLYESLKQAMKLKQEGKEPATVSSSSIATFSRKNQTEKLASLISKYLKKE